MTESNPESSPPPAAFQVAIRGIGNADRLTNLPNTFRVGEITQGFGSARVTYHVVEGPLLPPVNLGDPPRRVNTLVELGGYLKVFHKDRFDAIAAVLPGVFE